MENIQLLIKKIVKSTEVGEIKIAELKLTLFMLGLISTLSSLCISLILPYFTKIPKTNLVLLAACHLVLGLLAFYAYKQVSRYLTLLIISSICGMLPFLTTWLTLSIEIGILPILSFYIVLFSLSVFHSQYCYFLCLQLMGDFVFSMFFIFNHQLEVVPTFVQKIAVSLAFFGYSSVMLAIIYINNSKIKQSIKYLSTMYDQQDNIGKINNELQAQNEELQSLTSELQTQNIEIKSLYQQLDDSNRTLHNQNEVLLFKQKELHHMAYHDALAKIPNRKFIIQYLESKIYEAAEKNLSFGIILLDIDSFKHINDTMGHWVGDNVIQELALRLREAIPEKDEIGRMGGDEFAIVTDLVQSKEELDERLIQIKNVFLQPIIIEGKALRTTASIGISHYPGDSIHSSELLRFADIAMYSAKEIGRNAIQYYDSNAKGKIFRNDEVLRALNTAIEKEEFSLVFQPILSMKNNIPEGFETLLRWNSTDLGVVTPSEFIPIAEACGSMIAIGEWIFDTACKEYQKIQEVCNKDSILSINVSATELMSTTYVPMVIETMKKYSMKAHHIILEITESFLLKTTTKVLERIKELKEIGFLIAIDDFGSGYFSFNYLRDLDVDIIKIDRSFLSRLEHGSDEDHALLHGTTQMLKQMGFQITCEGVETQYQLNQVSLIGGDYAQGYYIQRPQNSEHLVEYLKNFS